MSSTDSDHGAARAGARRALVAGLLAIASVSGTRFAYGVVLIGLATHLNTSVSSIALGMAVHWVVFTITAPLTWRAYARWGARTLIGGGGLLCMLAFALLPFVQSPVWVVLVYGGLSGIGSHGLGQLIINQPVIIAIPAGKARDRGFGLIACGAPIGTAVFSGAAVLAVEAGGWQAGCVVLAVMIGLASISAAIVTVPGRAPVRAKPPQDRRSDVTRDRPTWLHPSFFLLGLGFAIALFTQTAVPFILPIWGSIQGFTGDQIAIAFVILGVAGVGGRLMMTRGRVIWGVRLWIVVPIAVLLILGCGIAALWSGSLIGFYLAVVLLGLSAPIAGALFAIAILACFPEESFGRVGALLLVAIGLASGFAAVLPGALVDSGLPLWAMWTLVGGLAVVSALAMLAAEWISPIYQANQAQPMH